MVLTAGCRFVGCDSSAAVACVFRCVCLPVACSVYLHTLCFAWSVCALRWWGPQLFGRWRLACPLPTTAASTGQRVPAWLDSFLPTRTVDCAEGCRHVCVRMFWQSKLWLQSGGMWVAALWLSVASCGTCGVLPAWLQRQLVPLPADGPIACVSGCYSCCGHCIEAGRQLFVGVRCKCSVAGNQSGSRVFAAVAPTIKTKGAVAL